MRTELQSNHNNCVTLKLNHCKRIIIMQTKQITAFFCCCFHPNIHPYYVHITPEPGLCSVTVAYSYSDAAAAAYGRAYCFPSNQACHFIAIIPYRNAAADVKPQYALAGALATACRNNNYNHHAAPHAVHTQYMGTGWSNPHTSTHSCANTLSAQTALYTLLCSDNAQ